MEKILKTIYFSGYRNGKCRNFSYLAPIFLFLLIVCSVVSKVQKNICEISRLQSHHFFLSFPRKWKKREETAAINLWYVYNLHTSWENILHMMPKVTLPHYYLLFALIAICLMVFISESVLFVQKNACGQGKYFVEPHNFGGFCSSFFHDTQFYVHECQVVKWAEPSRRGMLSLHLPLLCSILYIYPIKALRAHHFFRPEINLFTCARQ